VNTDVIKYRVPVSCVRISATITDVCDSILGTHTRTPEATIKLEVIGGAELKARIDSNWLSDTSVAFSMTDDGVLVSGSVDSTGEAGKVVLGVVSVGAALAGAVLGSPAAVGALANLTHLNALRENLERDYVLPPTPTDRDDPVIAAFARAKPEVYLMRKRYAELVEELQARIAGVLEGLSEIEEPADRREAMSRLDSDRKALEVARSESQRLDEVFNAWRALTLTTHTETHEILLTLDEIRLSGARIDENRRPVFEAADNRPAQGAKAKAEAIWRDLGVVVVLPDAQDREGEPHVPTQPRKHNKLVVRAPRRVTLDLYKRDDAHPAHEQNGRIRAAGTSPAATAVLVDSKPQLVMDELGELQTLMFRKSIWAKKSGSLKFSSLGALTGVATTRAAEAAALAETAQEIPGKVAGSLEQTKKLYDDVEALRDRSADARLVELKREVALKQNEISLAGLHATEAQAAELKRLQQEEAILKTKKAIADYPASAASTTSG
jgi:hypothetical protein